MNRTVGMLFSLSLGLTSVNMLETEALPGPEGCLTAGTSCLFVPSGAVSLLQDDTSIPCEDVGEGYRCGQRYLPHNSGGSLSYMTGPDDLTLQFTRPGWPADIKEQRRLKAPVIQTFPSKYALTDQPTIHEITEMTARAGADPTPQQTLLSLAANGESFSLHPEVAVSLPVHPELATKRYLLLGYRSSSSALGDYVFVALEDDVRVQTVLPNVGLRIMRKGTTRYTPLRLPAGEALDFSAEKVWHFRTEFSLGALLKNAQDVRAAGNIGVFLYQPADTGAYANQLIQIADHLNRGDPLFPRNFFHNLDRIRIFPLAGQYTEQWGSVGASMHYDEKEIRVFSARDESSLIHEFVHNWDHNTQTQQVRMGKQHDDPSAIFESISWLGETRYDPSNNRSYTPIRDLRLREISRWYDMSPGIPLDDADLDDFCRAYALRHSGSEDITTMGECYYEDSAHTRKRIREQMSSGRFVLAAKYLFMKCFVFESHEYSVNTDSPALSYAEVYSAMEKTARSGGVVPMPVRLAMRQIAALSAYPACTLKP